MSVCLSGESSTVGDISVLQIYCTTYATAALAPELYYNNVTIKSRLTIRVKTATIAKRLFETVTVKATGPPLCKNY